MSSHLLDPHDVKRTRSWRRVWRLAQMVAEELSCTAEEMMGTTRDYRLMRGRWCVYWLGRYGLELKWSQLRRAVNRDHSTVIVSVRRFGELMVDDSIWRDRAQRVLGLISENLDEQVIATVNPMGVIAQVTKARRGRPLKPRNEPVIDELSEVTWHERHGFYGTSRSFFKAQDDKFQAAVRRALQDIDEQDTNSQSGASNP